MYMKTHFAIVSCSGDNDNANHVASLAISTLIIHTLGYCQHGMYGNNAGHHQGR